ncbi:MAG: acyl-CoA reductase [Saprospiraceae bacterium]|nr:acyl-CoA reductase [Saprospiraceae bacterium]
MNSAQAFVALGKWIRSNDAELQHLIHQAANANPWFTPENVELAVKSVASQFLDERALKTWLSSYQDRKRSNRIVGLILAGNIPMVGFHDILCVLASGHRALVKLSDKDDLLIPALMQKIGEWYPDIVNRIEFVSRLKDFDAIIATGSNQSAAYFEKYFSKYPHIIRKNRNAVAVLTGNESGEELTKLGEDIFSHFGLGCRNVSKIYVPENYDFTGFLTVMNSFKHVIEHSKYRNNLDYHLAAAVISRQNYMSSDNLILLENVSISSKIGVLHYEHYDQLSSLESQLQKQHEQIQCIVAGESVMTLPSVRFGEAQRPALQEYADGVDTMQFLYAL